MPDENYYTFRGYELMDREKKKLTPSMEDYLEMIYRIGKKEKSIRMQYLAECLHVRTSSCTKIVQKLSQYGLVQYEKYGAILLSSQGQRLGEALYQRHRILEEFLLCIGNREDLLQDTELIEHYISPRLLENLERFTCFMKSNPLIKEQYDTYKISSIHHENKNDSENASTSDDKKSDFPIV